ncbi:MAG: HDIG domain-containing protein [Planctomycetaceae bacterium]|jgi:putative nucleotidyltransferase with HDIG domain|nr:HDIG domain-containing protein [Planctomycetaceae bacterium]
MTTSKHQRMDSEHITSSDSKTGEYRFNAIQADGTEEKGSRPRTRAERVAAHVTYYGLVRHVVDALQDVEIRKYAFLIVMSTLAMCIATQAWNPPFPYEEYDVPERDLICNTQFYWQEETPPSLTIPALQHTPLQQSLASPPTTTSVLTPSTSATLPPLPEPPENKPQQENIKSLPSDNSSLLNLSPESLEVKETSDLPLLPVNDNVPKNANLPIEETNDYTQSNADPTYPATPLETVISPSIMKVPEQTTLIHDELAGQLKLTPRGELFREFAVGNLLVQAGQPIMGREIRILKAEYDERLQHRTLYKKTLRFCGVFFLTLAMSILAIIFLHRRERRKPKTAWGMFYFYILVVATVVAATTLHSLVPNVSNLELIPILLLAQGVAIAFSWELSLVATMIVSFVVSLSQTNSIFTMILFVGVTAAIVIYLGRLRSRTKLVMVGSFGGLIAFLLTFFIEMVEGQEITKILFTFAALNASWTLAAAILMTALLPLIEHPCGILTDISLLELGDPSHPLLHELTRRAPATYSHSLQVASIAETAAEAIGARGLLVRVGAYFHDIGKILNPEYFTENQTPGNNIHDTLEPRMSTLVIVAHVKDGVDLVRQHRLPKPIIDLVEQHHGTSLVSFFHSLAARQSKDQGYTMSLDEGSFRYPGPKPQSKEAGILMLADASESACRSLRDASPNKIEALVRHISEDKLKDGQFDESGLTLRELRTIENSIINSILATRHNRISYPDTNSKKSSDSNETR